MKAAQAIKNKALAFGFLLAAFVAVGLLAAGPAQAVPMNFTVDTTVDTNLTACDKATPNDCTLRGAINAANANAGADTIGLGIPATQCAPNGVCIITPDTNLPAITEAVTINGYSQSGRAPTRWPRATTRCCSSS